MKKLLFFSNNKNKITEIKKIFNIFNLKLLSLSDVDISDEPAENAQTFEENAKIKSDYGFNKTGLPCFADDSGICIESLNWRPGVHSKRFIHKFKNEEDCFKHIIKRVEVSGKKKAYFKTSISLSFNKNYNVVFSGTINGNISSQRKGNFGFGYDPIFIPNSFDKTFAELRTEEKNKLSHRSIAVTKLVNFLIN